MIAALGNLAVAAAPYALYGWNAASAHAAARNTARYSALWFLVAFATPGLVRWIRTLSSEAVLLQAFVAAHLIHFSAVSVVFAAFDRAHVAQHPGSATLVILFGFTLTILVGLTAVPRASRPYTALRKVTLYAMFLIFVLAFANNRVRPLRLYAIMLLLALILRHLPLLVTRRESPAAP